MFKNCSLYTMAFHWLLSLWLVLEYMQFYYIVLNVTEVPSLTTVQKQPREALPGAGNLCSAKHSHEPRSVEARALAAASAFLNTPRSFQAP